MTILKPMKRKNNHVVCADCQGNGYTEFKVNASLPLCKTCKGNGYLYRTTDHGTLTYLVNSIEELICGKKKTRH